MFQKIRKSAYLVLVLLILSGSPAIYTPGSSNTAMADTVVTNNPPPVERERVIVRDDDDDESVLGVVGEVLAFPFRLIGDLFDAIF